jgi:hypothetical protein
MAKSWKNSAEMSTQRKWPFEAVSLGAYFS